MIALTLLGCRYGSFASPGPIEVEYTDPAGDQWTFTGWWLDRFHISGSDCTSATWLRLSHLEPWSNSFLLVAADTGVQQIVLETTLLASTPENEALLGGTLSWVVQGPIVLEADLADGCTMAFGDSSDPPCVEQSAPAWVRWEGPLLDYPLQELPGSTGYATDATTGEAICGGLLPGI